VQSAETQKNSKTYECSIQVLTCKKQLSDTSGQGCCTVDTHQDISPPVNMFVLIELPHIKQMMLILHKQAEAKCWQHAVQMVISMLESDSRKTSPETADDMHSQLT